MTNKILAPPPTLFRFWIPSGLLVMAVLVDVAVIQTTVSGLLGLLVIAALAFVLRPLEVAAWTGIYSCTFFGLLVLNAQGDFQWDTIIIRVSTLAVGGIVCVASAELRSRIQASRDELHQLLITLPVPALVADGDGVIQICNDRMVALFAASGSEIVGASFFTHFSDPDHRGQEISRYVRWVDSGVNAGESAVFVLNTNPPVRMQGTVCVASLKQRKAVIVCLTDEPLDSF
jgi:PAS domain-containing protein